MNGDRALWDEFVLAGKSGGTYDMGLLRLTRGPMAPSAARCPTGSKGQKRDGREPPAD